MKYYAIIAKCSARDDDFKKWRNVSNLSKFEEFLNREYPEWKFYNIYEKQRYSDKKGVFLECKKKPRHC